MRYGVDIALTHFLTCLNTYHLSNQNPVILNSGFTGLLRPEGSAMSNADLSGLFYIRNPEKKGGETQ